MESTYTVRQPGHTAWSGPGLTWSQACGDLHEAEDRGLNPRIYRDDSHADVTKWVGIGIEPRDGWDLCIYCGEPVDMTREQAAVHRACARHGVSEDWPEKEFADFAGLGRDPQEGEPQ